MLRSVVGLARARGPSNVSTLPRSMSRLTPLIRAGASSEARATLTSDQRLDCQHRFFPVVLGGADRSRRFEFWGNPRVSAIWSIEFSIPGRSCRSRRPEVSWPLTAAATLEAGEYRRLQRVLVRAAPAFCDAMTDEAANRRRVLGNIASFISQRVAQSIREPDR